MASESHIFVEQLKQYAQRQTNKHCFYKNKDCKPPLIRSHTIQNSTIIEVLAENGHVLLIRADRSSDPSFIPIGRNEASTFYGFCSFHDNSVFKKIDLNPGEEFDVSNKAMLNLLFFRGCFKEYILKSNLAVAYEHLVSALENKNTQMLNQILPFTKKYRNSFPWTKYQVSTYEAALTGTKKALLDFKPFFNTILNIIEKQENDKIQHDIIEFNHKIQWAVSSVVTPNLYFDNTHTPNNMYKEEYDNLKVHLALARAFGKSIDEALEKSKKRPWYILGINAFPTRTGSKVVLSYLQSDKEIFEKYNHFLMQVEDEQKEKLLTRLLISNTEDIAFNPKYIESLSPKCRNMILREFELSIPKDLDYKDLKLNLFR